MLYTTDDLVSAVKLSGFIPASDNTFTDANLIQLLNEELQNKIVPHILSVRQNFFLSEKQTNITPDLDHYVMPERAIGNEIQDLWYIADTSNVENKYPIPKAASPHEVRAWSGSGVAPGIYFLRGDEAVLVPQPKVAASALLWYYYRRPNKLVAVADCAKITAISVGASNTTFTVDTDLTANLSAGDLVDLISNKNPHLSWQDDATIISISATEIVIANSEVQNEVGSTEPQVGDWICEAQTAPMAQVPQEFAVILSEMGVYRCLKALGARQNLEIVAANIREMLDRSFKMISNRVDDSVDVIFERNSIINAAQNSSYRFTTK